LGRQTTAWAFIIDSFEGERRSGDRKNMASGTKEARRRLMWVVLTLADDDGRMKVKIAGNWQLLPGRTTMLS
jgi:hypothetical protein